LVVHFLCVSQRWPKRLALMGCRMMRLAHYY
jgi:hypothetical protein